VKPFTTEDTESTENFNFPWIDAKEYRSLMRAERERVMKRSGVRKYFDAPLGTEGPNRVRVAEQLLFKNSQEPGHHQQYQRQHECYSRGV
jgi:hypothetical protein